MYVCVCERERLAQELDGLVAKTPSPPSPIGCPTFAGLFLQMSAIVRELICGKRFAKIMYQVDV